MGVFCNMEKTINCPNNSFDCGVSCGLTIALEVVRRIMKNEKNPQKQITLFEKFFNIINNDIHEKHLEHLNEKYQWENILNEVLKS